MLPALGLVLAGLWGAESRGCCSRRCRAAPAAHSTACQPSGKALPRSHRLSCLPAMLIHGLHLFLVPPQPPGPHHNLGGARLDPPPQPPHSAAPCTHRGKRSAGGQSSPGPADGPELQLVPFAGGPGRRTPASLWGTDQHHPLAWGKKGFLSPPPHGTSPPGTPPGCPTGTAWHGSSCGCWAPLGRLGFGRSPVLCHSSQKHPSSAQQPMATGHAAARQGHGRGKEQGPVCCCCTSLALKNKILSSVFLQVFPGAAAFSRRVPRAGLTSANT